MKNTKYYLTLALLTAIAVPAGFGAATTGGSVKDRMAALKAAQQEDSKEVRTYNESVTSKVKEYTATAEAKTIEVFEPLFAAAASIQEFEPRLKAKLLKIKVTQLKKAITDGRMAQGTKITDSDLDLVNAANIKLLSKYAMWNNSLDFTLTVKAKLDKAQGIDPNAKKKAFSKLNQDERAARETDGIESDNDKATIEDLYTLAPEVTIAGVKISTLTDSAKVGDFERAVNGKLLPKFALENTGKIVVDAQGGKDIAFDPFAYGMALVYRLRNADKVKALGEDPYAIDLFDKAKAFAWETSAGFAVDSTTMVGAAQRIHDVAMAQHQDKDVTAAIGVKFGLDKTSTTQG